MKTILFLICAGLLAGCATKVPDVATYYDQISGYRTDLIPENLLETENPTRELLWLNASRVFRNRVDFDYYLEVHYEALPEPGWLQINPGESLVIVADDKEMRFDGRGSLNARRTRQGNVTEDALYLAGADQLRAMARAKKVTVRVIGQNGIVQRDFTPINFERFKKFVAQYVE